MMKFMNLGLLVLLTGCAKKVALRDAKTYGAEIEFIDKVVWQQHSSLNGLIASHCTCTYNDYEVKWSSTECYEAAETSAVVQARWQWHSDMMKYLGGLSDKKPTKEELVKVPTSREACKEWRGE